MQSFRDYATDTFPLLARPALCPLIFVMRLPATLSPSRVTPPTTGVLPVLPIARCRYAACPLIFRQDLLEFACACAPSPPPAAAAYRLPA